MKWMLVDYGRAIVDELLSKKHQILKYIPTELEELRDLYKRKLKDLK